MTTDINENELARRRKVTEIATDVAEQVIAMMNRLGDFKEFEINELEALRLTAERISNPMIRAKFHNTINLFSNGHTCRPDFAGDVAVSFDLNRTPMDDRLDILFAEAPKLPARPGDSDQAPALECLVTLPSGSGLQGVLSRTPEGLLKMMSQAADASGRQFLVEHFFAVHEISAITVRRDVKVTAPSPIVLSSS